jgi:hypothetical protein
VVRGPKKSPKAPAGKRTWLPLVTARFWLQAGELRHTEVTFEGSFTGAGSALRVCRKAQEFWEQRKYLDTAGGSFRYKIGGRIVYGISVSGQFANPPTPIGELDVWINTDKLAQVSGVAEESIKERFFKPFDAGRMKCLIRLTNTKGAELLLAQLRELIAQPPPVKKSVAVGEKILSPRSVQRAPVGKHCGFLV